ncbi:MAG TPA: putative photosynthetic complex assembly protein PuhE [Roseiflexaceae bacterium]|nr:putative photosynthetic complex assembly protein PuhE [Roseiflexaceae bacterium]
MQYLLPILYTIFLWWFSTGVIIYLDGLPQRSLRWSYVALTLLCVASLYGLAVTRDDTSVGGAYMAFTHGLIVWGWQIASFFMGYITGPRRTACSAGCAGVRHFWHGVQTCLYHELAIISGAVLVVLATWGGANQIGTYTFLILWGMHQVSKLNVFFGVRNLYEEFLPDQVRYLAAFFSRRPMNMFFPFSVTLATAGMVFLFQQAFAPNVSEFNATGYTFLCFLTALGVLELWLLVLPLPLRLWDWGLRSRRNHTADADVPGIVRT